MDIDVDRHAGWDDFSGDGDGNYLTPDYSFDFIGYGCAGYGYRAYSAFGSLDNDGFGDGWCIGAGNPDCTGGE